MNKIETTGQVHVQLETITQHPISRSGAREVLSGLDAFSVIIFDFEHITAIGQAFADEIYRVFQNTHPDIVIQEENMTAGVRFMVERAKSEARKSK